VVGLFAELDAATSRAFIADFGTQDAVDALSADHLDSWLKQRHYHVRPAAVLIARLRAAAPGGRGPAGPALAAVTGAYLAALDTVAEQITRLEQQITDALHAHPDAEVFTSLPRSGTVRAARPPPETGHC